MALSSRRLPSLLRVPASPVPRSRRYYEGATTSHPRVHGRLLVRFHCPRVPPGSCSPQRSRKVGGPLPGRGSWSAGARSVRLALCRVGVEPTGSLRVVSARIDDHPPLLLS